MKVLYRNIQENIIPCLYDFAFSGYCQFNATPIRSRKL